MDAELEAVKTALSKLKGCTIRTVVQRKSNLIEDICESKGFYVRRTAEPSLVRWKEVLGKYAQLRSDGTLIRSKKRDNGAFVTALLANLTTGQVAPIKPRTLRYLRSGLPVFLRPTSPYRRCP